MRLIVYSIHSIDFFLKRIFGDRSFELNFGFWTCRIFQPLFEEKIYGELVKTLS